MAAHPQSYPGTKIAEPDRLPPPHHGVRLPGLPLRVGTRGSPLALVQTRAFLDVLIKFCPVLRGMDVFQEHVIRTTGDAVQDRRLADIGGKGLFAKEIHEALSDRRIDFAVHSLKDLETELPPDIVLACTLTREDARDALVLASRHTGAAQADGAFPMLPHGALVGTASVRRQAQLLHARPDLRFTILRGSVQTRLDKLEAGDCDATLLALAGLKRLGLDERATAVLAPETMLPAACQGIIGVTVRTADTELRELLAAIEDPQACAVSLAERALLATLDGSCRTPIGGYGHLLADGRLRLTGLVARADGSFLLRRSIEGAVTDAERLGRDLGASLRGDSPVDIFV